MSEASIGPLKKTPLHGLHMRLGARMAEFGGYDMPIQYADGIMAEHNWTRTNAVRCLTHGAELPVPAAAGWRR
jgi:glycine cleavage system aminomethyltransferase T